MPIKQQI